MDPISLVLCVKYLSVPNTDVSLNTLLLITMICGFLLQHFKNLAGFQQVKDTEFVIKVSLLGYMAL